MEQREVPRAAQTTYEGIPAMTVAEAIRDCRGLLMPGRLIDAVTEAARAGLIRKIEANRLVEELDGEIAERRRRPLDLGARVLAATEMGRLVGAP